MNAVLFLSAATPVNDELEFVKMHTLTSNRGTPRQSPNHIPATNLAYESDSQSNQATSEYQQTFPTLDRPPSYETSMKNTRNVNSHYHATDRQSMRSTRSARSARSQRSTRSARSKGSTRSKRRQETRQERREDLPWVQITPSSSNLNSDNLPYRHFP